MLSKFFKKLSRSLIAPCAGVACGISYASMAAPLPDPATDIPIENEGGQTQKIVLAGGCFWGIEAVFQHVKGVVDAVSGYAGGTADTARYDAVSAGGTGHAEAVEVTYDPSKVTLGTLLKVYFSVAHNPTELNRQGPDVGTQYRSEIFFTTEEQEKVSREYIQQLQDADIFSSPVVTKISPLQKFYPAEDYHQDYAEKHPYQPYIATHDLPKVKRLEKEFPDLYVEGG